MKRIFLVLLPAAVLYSCSTARITDLPKAATEVNFTQYARDYREQPEPFWTSKTSNEYYFEKEKLLPEEKLITLIQEALKEKGYAIKLVDTEGRHIVGKRGMQANEWGSLTGVYYNISQEQKKIQLYIKTVITQDATGGWRENRAKKVALVLEQKINAAG